MQQYDQIDGLSIWEVWRKEQPAWHGWYLSNRIKSCRDLPGIEPGPAAWKAQALPLCHSASLMKKLKFNNYKVNMTFSPKPLHSTASRLQNIRRLKLRPKRGKKREKKKEKKKICSFGGSNSQPIGCGANVLHTTLQRHSHLGAKLLPFINSR